MARAENEIVLVGHACTPNGIVNAYPCVHCASQTQLFAILAVSMYALNHHGDYTLTNMLNDSGCLSCISEKQFWEGVTNSFLGVAIANGYFDDANAAIQAAECLTCTDPKHVKAILLKGICEYVNAQYPLA